MLTKAFVIRFPNGDFEYDLSRRAVPSIGETLRRKGVLWQVTRITFETVETLHVVRVPAEVSM